MSTTTHRLHDAHCPFPAYAPRYLPHAGHFTTGYCTELADANAFLTFLAHRDKPAVHRLLIQVKVVAPEVVVIGLFRLRVLFHARRGVPDEPEFMPGDGFREVVPLHLPIVSVPGAAPLSGATFCL